MKAIDYLYIKSLPLITVFYISGSKTVILYLSEIEGSSFHCSSTFIETFKIRRHLLGVTKVGLP